MRFPIEEYIEKGYLEPIDGGYLVKKETPNEVKKELSISDDEYFETFGERMFFFKKPSKEEVVGDEDIEKTSVWDKIKGFFIRDERRNAEREHGRFTFGKKHKELEELEKWKEEQLKEVDEDNQYEIDRINAIYKKSLNDIELKHKKPKEEKIYIYNFYSGEDSPLIGSVEAHNEKEARELFKQKYPDKPDIRYELTSYKKK